ncbi:MULTISPECIES: zf-HC2 domain-containing protein [Sphingomonas]|uniref:zf-HC2 domain-containing protein n=1 Tax=Sphingomonas TaxID=13687 RepID=UPI0017804D47|nr:zf-HC2 domain-containing protein [Sphingomonas sp. CFBP 13706]MBD8734318.1 zf-HC2 domain-containing protein [Sphingomonas sp. CFBP 13706]
MTQILPFPTDRHAEVHLLLPWYVTGQLDAVETAFVAEHLAECGACRADLVQERHLADAVARDTGETGDSWAAMAARLDATSSVSVATAAQRRRTRDPLRAARRAVMRPRTLRWVVAAQFVAVLALGAQTLTQRSDGRPGAYHVLGDAGATHSGNVLAMFRPEASEAAFRRALQASGARLVDGPTASGAYVLAVPGDAALARLRRDADVTMAEPIEQAPAK